jgi:hypothetical protein
VELPFEIDEFRVETGCDVKWNGDDEMRLLEPNDHFMELGIRSNDVPLFLCTIFWSEFFCALKRNGVLNAGNC